VIAGVLVEQGAPQRRRVHRVVDRQQGRDVRVERGMMLGRDPARAAHLELVGIFQAEQSHRGGELCQS